MINEILLVENLLNGHGINKKCLYQHCYLLAKYYLQQGYTPLETRQKIFDWACQNHLYLHQTSLNVNRLLDKASSDKRRLRGDEPVRISETDIKNITDRFDSVKARKVALALLCYAKAFADSDNQFQISIVSLCNWLRIGTTQMHTSYLKELQTFEYISRVQDADEKTIFSWDNVVKSKSGTYKLMVKFVNAGKYELHNNDIEDLYHRCFD